MKSVIEKRETSTRELERNTSQKQQWHLSKLTICQRINTGNDLRRTTFYKQYNQKCQLFEIFSFEIYWTYEYF